MDRVLEKSDFDNSDSQPSPSTSSLCGISRSVGAVDYTAFADGHAHTAQHCPAVKGSVARLGSGRGHLKNPFRLGVEDDHVGEGTRNQASTSTQVQEARRLGAEQGDQAAERDLMFAMEQLERQAQG